MTHLTEKTVLWDDLTDEQSEKLVGGVGAGDAPGAGANGWGVEGQPSEGHGLCQNGMFAPEKDVLHGETLVTHPDLGGDPPGTCP